MRKLALWLASLLIVAVVASLLVIAQIKPTERRVLSGNDIGFRLEGFNPRGEPVGTFVIRIDGEWVAPGYSPTVRPAK